MMLCSALIFALVIIGASGVPRPEAKPIIVNFDININGVPASGGGGETQDETIDESAVECSQAKGFFQVPESVNQCFKLFNDSGKTWEASKLVCQANGLELAKPKDTATAVALRKFIIKTYGVWHARRRQGVTLISKFNQTRGFWGSAGLEKLVWLGAKGTGSTVNWIRDGTTLSSNNSAWYPGLFDTHSFVVGTGYCLELMAREANMNSHPTKPYWMAGCSDTNKFPLCESF